MYTFQHCAAEIVKYVTNSYFSGVWLMLNPSQDDCYVIL